MHFCKTKCDAKMHFCTASLFFAKQKTQHFCTAEHFPLENVMRKMCKNAFLHQMHFCTAFVFCKAKNTAFCRFLTFWFAEHFPLENVRKNAFVTFCYTKCTHQMHLMPKCILATHQQNVRAASLFFAKQKTQHFCIKCIFAQLACQNAFLHVAEHFPKENVRVAEHFPLENVRVANAFAFWHQMHFCINACNFASNAFLHQNAFLHSCIS